MGPKKGKDIAAGENYWRKCIEDACLDDENWKVKVVIMEAAGSDQDRIYLNKFEIFAAEEKRFVIKNICKSETTFMINQLGGEKKAKDESLRVFEEGQSYLKDKKDIPADILALIIKHLILKMKEEYLFIKRQRLEVKEGLRRESTTMIDRAEVRGTVNVKPPEPPQPEPPPKGKGKKGELEPPQTPQPEEGKKYNTALRVRGEEWRDKVYVDDFPIDGPNIYVAITGFIEPFLASCLVKIGIPLIAIIQVRIDSSLTDVPSTLIRPTKRGQSQTEFFSEKSMQFWDDLQHMRINRDTTNDFRNTAFIVFSPPYWNSETLSGSPDKIYDELCYLMYDVQDLSRQHLNYLDNMDTIHIPEDAIDDRYATYYQQQIQDLPLECVTIFSVLDSILQSVEKSQAIDEKSSRTSLSTALTLIQNQHMSDSDIKVKKAENLVNDLFNSLCKTDSNRKTYRITYGEEYENHKDPIIIHYGDVAKYTTFHLGNINLDNIVWRTLFGMPIHRLWLKQKKPQAELEAKINFHINVLLSCFDREDVETAQLNRLIHILACRKLYNNRSSLKKKHLPSSTISSFKKVYLKRCILAEPLPQNPLLFKKLSSMTQSFPSITKSESSSDDSNSSSDPEAGRIRYLFDCPDISELVSASEIANNKPASHLIEDYEHFEDFKGVSAFQVMLEAFSKFNCVDYKYCEVTDCFVLMFFNSHDSDGIAREEWRCHIPTPLCLQDFFDYVLEEQYDWIQNEEKIYDELMTHKSKSTSKESVKNLALKTCVENTDVASELLIEGSLKHQELVILEDIKEKTETTESKPASSKKTTLSPTSIESDSKASKKGKSPTSTPKRLRQSFTAPATDNDTVPKVPKPFIGYDLGDRRVEVFGHNSSFFSRDGTRVISKYTLTIPINVEYLIMSVVPGNSVNEFFFHRALGEDITPQIRDMCESFRIDSKDRAMINIKKQTYQELVPILSEHSTINTKTFVSKHSDKAMPEKQIIKEEPIYCEKYFHSLFITWPNGLITESVHLDNSPNISHIKQFYLNPLPQLDEDMRCVSLNGEVIIFRPSGIIEVLQPDGTFIKITKCEKRVVEAELASDIRSETSSDKSKKAKGKEKDKGKDKSSKTSSRSSKNAMVNDEENKKPPDYKLFIDEFETIETNGMRLKWVNETPYPIEKLLIRTATDYCLREVFSRRMDGTNILLNKNGVQVVTFPNNTRIITSYFIDEEEVYPEWTEEEKEYLDLMDSEFKDTDTVKSKGSISQKSYTYSASVASDYGKKGEEEEPKEKERTDGYLLVQITYTIEHVNYTTVTINKGNGKISIDSPNKTTVVVDMDNHYFITLDDATTAYFDGHTMNLDYVACAECLSKTTSTIYVKTEEESSVTKIHQNWLKMKDSFCKKIVVNEEGHISILNEACSLEVSTQPEGVQSGELTPGEGADEGGVENLDVVVSDDKSTEKSENSFVTHGKCREMYLAKTIRLFVLRRELSCSELVHRVLLEQYNRACQWQPWCSMSDYNAFGDHRSLKSILSPVHITESEKWLMDSKLADKPKHLAYKDLKPDSGKGFYHWMRPYERFQPKPIKPENVIPPRLPRAFVMRTLERQWPEKESDTLKGAKELLTAILRYRQIMDADSETILHVPIRDPRSEAERRTDHIIQALGHKVYEDLKTRLLEDVQSRAKATITTKPKPEPSEHSVEGEIEEETFDCLRALEEERESLLKDAEADEMSPNLRRYWRRRAEELKEEQFYLYLLREGSVPPYFRNILGGAIWWEMNNLAGEAVTKAERKKMKCVCAEEGTSRTEDTPLPFM